MSGNIRRLAREFLHLVSHFSPCQAGGRRLLKRIEMKFQRTVINGLYSAYLVANVREKNLVLLKVWVIHTDFYEQIILVEKV